MSIETNSVGQPSERLLHGTALANLDRILRDGLVPGDMYDFGTELTAVYLTDGFHQAVANAWKHSTDGAVLTVDVSGLPLLVLGFTTCMVPIGPERILAHHVVSLVSV